MGKHEMQQCSPEAVPGLADKLTDQELGEIDEAFASIRRRAEEDPRALLTDLKSAGGKGQAEP